MPFLRCIFLKWLILFFVNLFCITRLIKAQSIKTDSSAKTYKPEILTSGFIDVVNNGQVNASARFLRLYIGEQGHFAIPLSIYSGVSSNSFQNQLSGSSLKSNEALVNNFINPLSGLVNLSVNDVLFIKKKESSITRTGFLYHAGEKVLTGFKTGPVTSTTTGNPVNFINTFCSAGIYFQTGAWERSNTRNVGIFWLTIRYISSYSSPKQLREIMSDIQTNGIYTGYSIAGGVEINNLVNIKILYYKYLKAPEIDYGLPIYQFSFNYALRN